MVANIYENRNYRLFVVVPIALLLISLYFIPRIQLDSTLRGGISVQFNTNSTLKVGNLTSYIDAKIPQAQASVSISQGSVSVTMAANQSIANAQEELLNIYGEYSNWSTASAQIATYQHALSVGQNATIEGALNGATSNQTASLAAINTQTGIMLQTLKPLLNRTYSYNSSSADAAVNSAKLAYTDATGRYKAKVVSILQGIVPFSTYQYSAVTPTLGAYFLQQMEGIIIASFILVGIAVFLIFRTPIPSLAVVFGSGNDIIVALGAMGLFGIPLGIASIGGLLMLIGYSIDTDMLSAIRILKRTEGTPSERAFATMKTGMTMTFAAIITFTILLVVSYITFIPTYFEISSVVLFGLIADLATTWLGNTPMILWYKKGKEVK